MRAIERAAVAAVAIVLVVAPAAVVAQEQEGTVVGRPEIEIAATDNRLSPGETTLEVWLSNSGVVTSGGPPEFEQRVRTARNVRLEIAADELEPPLSTALSVESGPVLAGTVPPGSAGPFTFQMTVDEDVPPGTYRIPFEITYVYSRFVEYRGSVAEQSAESTVTRTDQVTVVVEDGPRFEVQSRQDAAIPPGESGEFAFEVSNDGSLAASDVRVVLETTSPSVFFGRRGNPQGTQSVLFSGLEPGESRTVAVRVGVRNTTESGVYPLTAVVRYDDPRGIRESSEELVLGVAVDDTRRFAVRNVTGTLRVGTTGTVRGEVVSLGQQPAMDAVVVLRPPARGLVPRVRQVPVGTLGPNESAPFSFRVDVSNRTQAGPQQVVFRIRHGSGGDVTTSERLLAEVTVAPRRGEFRVEPVDAVLGVDDETVLVVNATNLANETVRDVQATLSVADPFESDDPTSFVAGLEPGETGEFRFDLETTNDAIPKTDSVTLRFAYTDESGERRTTDPHLVPVEVVRPTDGAFPVVPAAVAVGVVVLGAGWWWLRR